MTWQASLSDEFVGRRERFAPGESTDYEDLWNFLVHRRSLCSLITQIYRVVMFPMMFYYVFYQKI